MAFQIVTEALARIEHKLDLILRAIKYQEAPERMPMDFIGHECPVCGQLVKYTVDLINNVVVRRCQCTTGKLAPTSPLFPATPTIGDANGRPTADDATRGEGERPASLRRRR